MSARQLAASSIALTVGSKAMTRRALTFRQADVARAVKAIQATGLTIGTVEVAPDGTIRLILGSGAEVAPGAPFDIWKAKHAG